jgi:DNA-directed RNA polymerase II subunit RPB2
LEDFGVEPLSVVN